MAQLRKRKSGDKVTTRNWQDNNTRKWILSSVYSSWAGLIEKMEAISRTEQYDVPKHKKKG